MIHAQRCFHTSAFLDKAQRWQDTWNFYRTHCGLGMRGMTSKEKLKYSKTMVHSHVQLFPVLLLESVLKIVGTFDPLKLLLSGKYVHTMCQLILHLPISIKRKKVVASLSSLKYGDSYVSAIDWANLVIECRCPSAFWHTLSLFLLLSNPSQSFETSIRLDMFIFVSPIFTKLQYKSLCTPIISVQVSM